MSEDQLYSEFSADFPFDPTDCQKGLFRSLAHFLTHWDEGDILVVNGYAGSGKTSAISSAISTLGRITSGRGNPTVLLAPTGRSAKVFSHYAGRPAYTIHKAIYRQTSSGFGQFSLGYNKLRDAIFFVDEVSLVGIGSADERSIFGSGNLLSDLIQYVRSGNECRLVFIGDRAQLPPVGLSESPALDEGYMSVYGGVNFCTLTTVVRQKKESGILLNATALRRALFEDMLPRLRYEGLSDIKRVRGDELIDSLSSDYSRYGEDGVVVLARSNKRAIRYNLGIRAQVLYNEDMLSRGDRVMVVKNNYLFVEREKGRPELSPLQFIANGDIINIDRIGKHSERYGLHFLTADISFPDYDDVCLNDVRLILDCLTSESASLTRDQDKILFEGVQADYMHIANKKDRYKAISQDDYFNALQIKYAAAITTHKSQGGGWPCVYIDYPYFQGDIDDMDPDTLRWLYTAFTRATEKVCLVNFPDEIFER